MVTREGHLDAQGCVFGIVVSKFNDTVTNRLLSETLATLKEAGAQEEHIEIVRVPGAFEIPLVARCLAKSGRFDAVICLGAVIRGETPHFDFISRETSRGIAQASLDSGIPVVFGVLTTNSEEQAIERAGSAAYNRGRDAAYTAIEMATLMKQLQQYEQKRTGFLGIP